ncbi:hypothetical protein PFISCL1PPCAC_13929 [Pristionchus fissidentatus]|uniref:Copper transport protein n=1 Tax=Pristionchus fissidentatus TaxID=1538716 RepID=A0AAV5VXG4_9BILA|nr:hypothetical protein PFISCL1PPCAC_13929 [Pristionchus fissidentatus]
MSHGGMDMAAAPMAGMVVHFGHDETIMFDFWKTSSPWGIVLSCVILAALSVIKESVRVLRTAYAKSTERSRNAFSRVVDAVLHAVTMFISYTLMVIFMNLNVWLSITIVIAEVLCHAISSYLSQMGRFDCFEK